MNPTSQHQFGLSRAVTEPQPASALSPSPSAPLALQQQQPNLEQLQWLPHPGVSCGSITSDHIRWVTSLRSRKGRWLSEMQQARWTQTENDYYEFTFELFQSGFLKGVEVGLPIRFFMSELLGCSMQRIDQKLMEDKRVPDLRCPHHPQRELVECERQGLIKKLHRLERAFLMREKGPLLDRVRYNSPEDASRFLHLFYSSPQEVDHDRISGATSNSSAACPSCDMTNAPIMLPTLESRAAADTSLSTVDMAPAMIYTSHMMPVSTSQVSSTPDILPTLTEPSTEAAKGQQGIFDQQQLETKLGCLSGYSSSAAGVTPTGEAASPSMTMSETVASLNSAEGTHPASSVSGPTQNPSASGVSSSHNEAGAATRDAFPVIDAGRGGLRRTSSPAGSMMPETSASSPQTGVFTMLDLLSATGARINEMRQTTRSVSMATSTAKPSHQKGLADDTGSKNGQVQTSSAAESLMTAVETSSYQPATTAVPGAHSEVEALEDGQSRTSAVENSILTTGAAGTSGAPLATGAVGNALQQKIPSNQTKTTTTPELFEDSNRRPRVSTREALPHKGKAQEAMMFQGQRTEVLQQSQGQQVSVLQKEQGQQKAACADPPFPPVGGILGEALGLNLLGVRRKESPGEGPPPAKRRVSNGGVHQDSRTSVSEMVDANEGSCMPDSAEDEAAMEYLKWELHGKFMAFPGEHYHKLLSCLAYEIYHNRYPVEYGIDVLHAVMREAGPGAAKKCAHTLKMNIPTKVT